jgi:hypothetical protein
MIESAYTEQMLAAVAYTQQQVALRRRRLILRQQREGGLSQAEIHEELARCKASLLHFVETHCQIYDATAGAWIPFLLWPEQRSALQAFQAYRLVVILKARQLGLSWLVLAFILWLLLFEPIATALVFSLLENSAQYLIGTERLRGMYKQLPPWMKLASPTDNAGLWLLANGSNVRAFSTNGGDSFTASLAMVDEADLVPDLNKLMRSVKPTIDGGGRMILLSRSNKKLPQSEFKAIYKAAKAGLNGWHAIFLPWYVRPSRTPEWYEQQKIDCLMRTGGFDDLWEQYPATDTEALAPAQLDKRIPFEWLQLCYAEALALDLRQLPNAPAIPGLRIFKAPEFGRRYAAGCDTAEGNPTSDDSTINLLDVDTGEQVAVVAGKFQPAVTGAYIRLLCLYYNQAPVMVERNNHGHAVLLWLRDNGGREFTVLVGDDGKPGWLDNSRGKSLLYDAGAEAFRTRDTLVHDFTTFNQLATIEGGSLRAPDGEMDDLADVYCLSLLARLRLPKSRPRRGSVSTSDYE